MSERAARHRPVRRDVLFIEDEKSDLECLGRLLAGTIHSVTGAPSIAAAEPILRSRRFDVVLIDLRQSDVTLLETVEQVLTTAGGIPVVALTQSDEPAYECLEAGLQDFIPTAGLTSPLLSRALEHAIVRARSGEMAKRLDLAERQATLARIASYVAHEINNQASLLLAGMELAEANLVSIRGEVSESGLATFDQAIGSIDEGRQTVERIGSIVRQLQLLGNRKSVAPRRTDVGRLVERTVNMMGNRLRQSATLTLDLQPCSPAAIDEDKLAQVLVNLLRNAAEATTGDLAQQRISVRLHETAEQVVLAVSDTGAGIRPEDLPHIFRPFFSTKTGGTGIGLAVSIEIVAAAGGTLTVSTELARGTTFTVTLPRVEAGRASTSSRLPPSQQRRWRVLMADDDPALRAALSALIRRHHDVVEASSGDEALEILERDTDFDAILCDLMMPGTDGTAVYDVLQRKHPEVAQRFALLTGGAFTPATTQLVESGTVVVISKPCGRRDLLATIETLACGVRQRNPG